MEFRQGKLMRNISFGNCSSEEITIPVIQQQTNHLINFNDQQNKTTPIQQTLDVEDSFIENQEELIENEETPQLITVKPSIIVNLLQSNDNSSSVKDQPQSIRKHKKALEHLFGM